MNTHLELSFVIPCFNEEQTIEICVRKAASFIKERGVAAEIIVADNGSSDRSREIAASAGARVVEVFERGYGAALQGGIREARGVFVIMGDADDSYDFLSVMPLLDKLREGYDLVMGNRFKGGIAPGAMPFLHRYLGNPGLTLLAQIFFRSPVGDIYCGMRGFRKSAIVELGLRSTGMEFAIEMVVKSTLFKKRICEVPFGLVPDGRDRPPHLRTWRDGWRTLRFMLLYAPNWLFLGPSAFLTAFGVLVGGALVVGPLEVGGVGLDSSSLLVAAMALVLGVQLFCFFLCARIFAVEFGLLPPHAQTISKGPVVKLEVGVLVGVGLMLGGVAALAQAILWWREAQFGPLPYSETLRLVIPAVTAITVGAQVIFASFLLSMLGIVRRSEASVS